MPITLFIIGWCGYCILPAETGGDIAAQSARNLLFQIISNLAFDFCAL